MLNRFGRFGRSLAIASNHDHAEETSYYGAAEQEEDDGDADGPDAGREEGLDWVGVVDEGLSDFFRSGIYWMEEEISYHEQSPDGVVGEDCAGEDEHGEAYDAVELGEGLVLV